MGQTLPCDRPALAPGLGACRAILRFRPGNQKNDLHDQQWVQFEVALVQKTDRFHRWHPSLHERQGAPPRLQSKLRHSLVDLPASLRVYTNWKSLREVARRASH